MVSVTVRTSLVRRPLLASSCWLLAVACSGGGAESSEVAAEPAQPAAADTPADPAALPEPAESPGPTPNAAEGSPLGADLEQPAQGPDSPAAPPGPDVSEEAGTPLPSPGCGAAQAAESGRFTIDVAGAPREYILELPDDYDATQPYRLVFTWHPGGGSAQGTANNFYGIRQNSAGSAIFVSPEGIDQGWANTDGRDIAFLDAMLERFRGELCFDETRVFSTGFSYGGMMSFAIGCGRADIFRAIAPMSGALFSGCEDGDAGIAMLGFHGVSDTVVDIAAGVRARDVIVERNGCQADGEADDSGCLAFQGCSQGNPVTWCEFDGGHTPAPQAGQRIWDFFAQF